MDDPVDLERYFERVGYRGSRVPTIEVLHALTAAHSESIPFENLDVLLGKPIRLEIGAIYHKLVEEHRGGYCFEQNGLLMAVLSRLGFEVRPLSARVRVGVSDRQVVVPRTHLVLEVNIAGELWLTDVGVGSASLTCALRFQADIEQPTPHETRRLVRADGKWFHQIRYGDEWADVYEFTGEEMPFVDRKVASWYTSTHSDSKFRRHLSVALARPGGRRVTLFDHELTLRGADGAAEKQAVSSPEQLLGVLHDRFGLTLPAGAGPALFTHGG